MCHYIILIVAGDSESSVDTLMRRHGRVARPIRNVSVAAALDDSARQYLTTDGCDCGTALINTLSRKDVASDRRAALKRKGWSDAKIERALMDRGRADDRTEGKRPDSVREWMAVFDELLSERRSSAVGVMVHFYAGEIESERIALKDKHVTHAGLDAALSELREDELLIVKSP